MKKKKALMVSALVCTLSLSAGIALAEENPQKKEKAYDSQLMTVQECTQYCVQIDVEKKAAVREQEHHEREIMQNRDERGIFAR